MPAPGLLLPTLALLLNALFFGLSWWPFRQLQALGLHPLWATSLAFMMALAGLWLIQPRAWRQVLRHPMLWLLMAASGMTNVGFNWAVTEGDVVRVVLLFYLMPAWALLLAWPLLGERPNHGALARLALALAGLAIVLKTPGSPWPVPDTRADWLAMMGGFCFALTNVLLLRLNHTPSGARMLAMFAGGALMATAAAAFGQQLGLVKAPPGDIGHWIAFTLAVSAMLLGANLALQYGAARLPSSTTSLVMLSEVVFASVSSILLGAATLSTRSLAGGALIMLAAGLAVFSRRKV